MCGIAGWVDYKKDLSCSFDIVEKMCKTLSKRGPDAHGIWISNHVAFGHRRLTVVDPEGGAQPMIRKKGKDEYVITYNGELYNTEDLRKVLQDKGREFHSTSDTEVLLRSYMEWGPDCVERLNGIYAFGIWDPENKKLFLARDRFGVKPLFYTVKNSSIIFGSELKTLLAHPDVRAEIDSEGLAEVFSLGPARTPGHGVYKGINEVKPAHCIIFDNNGEKMRKYWSLSSHEHTDDLDTTIGVVRELLVDSIERQLVSDVPLCTFLSGGLDSSIISAVSANYFKRNDRVQLHTYSIDYVDNDKYFEPSTFQPNEDAPWVKYMADEIGSHHHNIKFDTPQITDSLIDAFRCRDLPGMADIDSSLLLFCREIKKEHTVGLSGECADEVFGGYPWFHKEEMLNANTFPWSRSINERTKVYSKELIDMIKPEEYVQRRYLETLEEVPKMPGESTKEARRREIAYLNLTWFMATLLDRKDRMTMGTGLEVRVPFCDHRLVQYVWNIPWNMKALNGREKGLLREAARGILPDDVIERKKSPYPKTHNPSYEKAVSNWFLEILSDKSSPLIPLIDINAVRSLAEGKSDYGKPWFGQLMATPQMFAYLIQVDTWLREYNVSIV